MRTQLKVLSALLVTASLSLPAIAQTQTRTNTKHPVTAGKPASPLPPSKRASFPVVTVSAPPKSSTQLVVPSSDGKAAQDGAETTDRGDALYVSILSKYVKPGTNGETTRVDYDGLSKSNPDMAALDRYIKFLSKKQPSTMNRPQQMAYWANLYNALTIQVVAQNYPVKSIREIKSGWRKGPWRRKLVIVEGRELTLDNIEHDIMRPSFKTPLVHYMVNCASIGCPNLKPTPWQAKTLDADLERAARAYINSPRGVRIENGHLTMSSIYNWFKKDFGNRDADIIAHVSTYMDEPMKESLRAFKKIDKYGYDWSINAYIPPKP